MFERTVHNNRDWLGIRRRNRYRAGLSLLRGHGKRVRVAFSRMSRGFRKKKASSNAWPLKRLANQNHTPSATELDPSSWIKSYVCSYL